MQTFDGVLILNHPIRFTVGFEDVETTMVDRMELNMQWATLHNRFTPEYLDVFEAFMKLGELEGAEAVLDLGLAINNGASMMKLRAKGQGVSILIRDRSNIDALITLLNAAISAQCELCGYVKDGS